MLFLKGFKKDFPTYKFQKQVIDFGTYVFGRMEERMDWRENDKSLQSNCLSVRWRKGKRDSAMEEGILSSHGANSNLNWMVFDLPNKLL
jgi:hypothetical protein